ncbi:hypothetical protein KGF54_004948 [Candida jiufengensis]|uniref:uncharacterized protein n=1 Tax=Candida jiufengensis TaxID=497108 RepID=UPI002224B112|nr:uncharacterized protein KGF54_004948 [Candida jiufengensis]KAI5951873.1 hypothetical protein KGF54_004948 [Candida jiufengensis]
MYDKSASHFQYLPTPSGHHQPITNQQPPINAYTPNTSSSLHISSIPQQYQQPSQINSDPHFQNSTHQPQMLNYNQPPHQIIQQQTQPQLSQPTTQYNQMHIPTHLQNVMQQQQLPQHLHQSDPAQNSNSNSNSSRRGPWSPLEDKKLLELISLYGPTNWVRISNKLETRTPKQCRERYHQNLKPSLNRAPISPEEGELIEKLVAQYGKKWAEISRHLNGRSDNAIKNWWNGGANRRRRASLATSTSQNSIISENERKLSDDESKVKVASSLPQPPQAPPSAASMSSSSSLNYQNQPQPPNTHHLPQIAFNTSMFGNQGNEKVLPSISNPLVNNHSPLKPSNFRSASFDINSNTLPPISQPNKRRLIDDQFSRRHSSVHSMLLQAHSNGSHSNLAPHNNNQSQSGNVSPSYHGSPLMLSTAQSRNNSISHFELINNNLNLTSSSSRRSSSIAPEFFPNPLKSDHHLQYISQQQNQHYQNQAQSQSQSHKRNFSQNSSFNSPSLTPSTRFSISSTNSILNPNSTINTSSSILTSPSHSYYKNEFAMSNTSINKVEEQNEDDSVKDKKERNNSSDGDDSEDHENGSPDGKPPKLKMSVSSLVD